MTLPDELMSSRLEVRAEIALGRQCVIIFATVGSRRTRGSGERSLCRRRLTCLFSIAGVAFLVTFGTAFESGVSMMLVALIVLAGVSAYRGLGYWRVVNTD